MLPSLLLHLETEDATSFLPSRVCRTCHKSCGTYFHVCCLLQWLGLHSQRSLFSYSSINCSLSTKCWVPQTVHIQISGIPPYRHRHPCKTAIYIIADTSFGPECICVQAPEIPPYYGQTAVAGSNTLEWLHCVPHRDTCIQ